MTNPMFNPQPNYSGVTIQIANPSVYAGGSGMNTGRNNMNPEQDLVYNPYGYVPYCPKAEVRAINGMTNPALPENYQTPQPAIQSYQQPAAYPPQYYLNNYNYQNFPLPSEDGKNDEGVKAGVNTNSKPALPSPDEQKNGGVNEGVNAGVNDRADLKSPENAESGEAKALKNEPLNPSNVQTPETLGLQNKDGVNAENPIQSEENKAKALDNTNNKAAQEKDMTKSTDIINDLDNRAAEAEAEKKNKTKEGIVPLTDEYIKSLENYLDNPNDEIRLMAAKEILTRLDEDKDRYDDAALNALLNKMLQDPSKLIRIASLSAYASGLASGNDYTVTLLHNIQQNPNADKEDVLQAADILLRMSAGEEVKDIPNPSVKETPQENKGK